MTSFCFIRPWWLLALLAVLSLAVYGFLGLHGQHDWLKYGDKRLIEWQELRTKDKTWQRTWLTIILSLILMVIALSGPSWQQYPQPLTQVQKPVMVVLDLSSQMLFDDITPSRLQRAKFLIEDLLTSHSDLQWGLLVFSKASFLVSPLSSDIQNMLNFLPVLQPKILPVGGYDVEKAILKARDFLHASGAGYGRILVISSQLPHPQLQSRMISIERESYELLWVFDADRPLTIKTFEHMPVVGIKSGSAQINAWLNQANLGRMQQKNLQDKVMQRKDEGPWFLGFAMLLFLNVFRKGWFLRLWV